MQRRSVGSRVVRHIREVAHAGARHEYSLGWGVLPRDWADGLALTHNGSNLRWYAMVWLAPERDLAMLAVTNVGGDLAFVGVDEAVLAMIERFEAADRS